MSKFIELNRILNSNELKQNQETNTIYVNVDNISSFRQASGRFQSIITMNQCSFSEFEVSESVDEIVSKISE